jgi:hypothetical protein
MTSVAHCSCLDVFMPHVADREPAALFTPAEVSDSNDGQMSHLHGLNLSRARRWRRIASALTDGDPAATRWSRPHDDMPTLH